MRISVPNPEMTRAPEIFVSTERSETLHSEKAVLERSPAHCTGYPIVPCSSIQSVESPDRAHSDAAALPAGPAPMIITSYDKATKPFEKYHVDGIKTSETVR